MRYIRGRKTGNDIKFCQNCINDTGVTPHLRTGQQSVARSRTRVVVANLNGLRREGYKITEI